VSHCPGWGPGANQSYELAQGALPLTPERGQARPRDVGHCRFSCRPLPGTGSALDTCEASTGFQIRRQLGDCPCLPLFCIGSGIWTMATCYALSAILQSRLLGFFSGHHPALRSLRDFWARRFLNGFQW
jgi:hypothetical protein